MSLDAPLNGAKDWTEPGPLVPISDVERERLLGLEEVIDAGLISFVAVGTALTEVRDDRLYRESHPTFEAYCSERWGISRPRAYELMSAAVTVSAMADSGAPLPANERQARALAAVPAEERPEVMTEAAKNGKPTAKGISDVIEARHPKPEPSPAPLPPPPADAPAAESAQPPPVSPAPEGAGDEEWCDACEQVKPGATGGSCPECWQASEGHRQPKPKAPKPPAEKMWETAKVLRKGFNEMPSAREAMALVPADDMADLLDLANQAVAWGKAFKEGHQAAARLRLMGVK